MAAKEESEFDLIVIGSGAGGMTAALVGAIQGLSVLLLERSNLVGGTTAISAGSAWVPNSHHDRSGKDSAENTLRYLDVTVGNHTPQALKQAFVEKAPEMVRLLEDNSEVKFRPYAYLPDYYSELEGATVTGRALETVPFDGRLLGKDFDLLHPPLPEFTILGGMMVSRADIANLLGALKSTNAFLATLRLLGRHGLDRLRYRRGTRLVMGNALVARLLLSLRQRGVTIETDCHVRELTVEQGSVTGVAIDGPGGTLQHIRARRGVVLATGGFSHHPQLRAQLLFKPTPQYSAVPAENDGGGLELGMRAGGALGDGQANNAYWAPVSVRPRADGTDAVFPHFALDRGKPGMIAVDGSGRRFVNEATSYQLFSEAIYSANAQHSAIPCYLMCDASALYKYGLGMVRPLTRNPRNHQRDGYLVSSPTLAGLASQLGIDPEVLTATVQRYNEHARRGEDPDFGKGTTRYSRNIGDASVQPNPCVGPLETAPFHAIALYPADIATSCGLRTNADAQVLDAAGRPILGLYAAGNDMHSVMGGVYAGPGITIGTAMTFAYVAAMHAANPET